MTIICLFVIHYCITLLYTLRCASILCLGHCCAIKYTSSMLQQTFCDRNTIKHFCVILPLLQLSCTSIYVNEIVLFIAGKQDIIVSTVIVFTFYGFILSSILKIQSTAGRSRAFSPCSSYKIAVSMLFESYVFMDLQSSSDGSMDEDKISSTFYTIMISRINHLTCCLRNKDAKVALKKKL